MPIVISKTHDRVSATPSRPRMTPYGIQDMNQKRTPSRTRMPDHYPANRGDDVGSALQEAVEDAVVAGVGTGRTRPVDDEIGDADGGVGVRDSPERVAGLEAGV
jgi:hypothetical protein